MVLLIADTQVFGDLVVAESCPNKICLYFIHNKDDISSFSQYLFNHPRIIAIFDKNTKFLPLTSIPMITILFNRHIRDNRLYKYPFMNKCLIIDIQFFIPKLFIFLKIFYLLIYFFIMFMFLMLMMFLILLITK